MPTAPSFPAWGWNFPARVLIVVWAGVSSIWILALAAASDRPTVPMRPLVVDLNHVRPEVLEVLPRLGPVLVRRIVGAREKAPLRSVEELDRRIKGIGPVTLKAVRPFVAIDPAASVSRPREPR